MVQTRSQDSGLLSLPLELQTAILKELLPDAIDAIRATLFVCRQLSKIAVPLSVQTFRYAPKYYDSDDDTAPKDRIYLFLKYVTVTKPFLAPLVKQIICTDFTTREDHDQPSAERKRKLTAAERHCYDDTIRKIFAKGKVEGRGESIKELFEDLEAGLEEPVIVLLLAACRNVEDFCYGEPFRPKVLAQLVKAVAASAHHTGDARSMDETLPLTHLRSVYHESTETKYGYLCSAEHGAPFFTLPRVSSYECVMINAGTEEAQIYDEIPRRSSAVEHIALRNGCVSGPMMQALVGACAGLRSFDYSHGIYHMYDGQMTAKEIVDAMLPHAETLGHMDLNFDPNWQVAGNLSAAKEEADVALAREIFGHQIDGDEALKAISAAGSVKIDAATNERLKRKIDRMLMPLLCVVYGINYLDKVTLSYASITGIVHDLHLTGSQYSWLGSVFYFGYLAFEYPVARLLQRLPLAKYSAFMMIAWGTVLACFAAVDSFSGAIVIRLMLGIFEAAVSPGWALFTSQWYTKEEQATRTAWWASFNGWSAIFGGLVAYGIAHGAETHSYSIAPWKIIYLFTGCLTIALGIVFLLIVPDNQLNAWWLSPEDRVLAVERVRSNQQGIGNKHFKFYQLQEALLDPMVWSFCVLALAGDIPNGGLTNFFSLLIVSFGYTAEQSLLYGCISGALEVAILLGWAYLVMAYGQRILWGVGAMGVALLGAVLLVALPPTNGRGRLAGFYLAQFFAVAIVVIVSMLATNVAGYTKKTAVAALFFIFYCAGNIIGPQTFRSQDAPQYIPAEITLIVCYGVCAIDLVFLYWWLNNQNKKKAAIRAKSSYTKLENQEFLDLTDGENPEFIYVL